jgi:hypothetical protein
MSDSGVSLQLLGLTIIIIGWFWRIAHLLAEIKALLERKDNS